MRSFTIDAENEEDFIKQYEKSKSHLSEMNFKKKREQENNKKDDEDDLIYQKKENNSFKINEIDESDYSDLGAINNEEDEDLLGTEYENDNIINNEEDVIKIENKEEKGIEVLVTYLKSTIMGELKNMDLKGNTIIFNKNRNIMSMSGNAIYDLNMRELVDNILAENDNEYIKSNEGNNNSLRDYIFQNIESDSTLKIMVMSNNRKTKISFMNKFFDLKNNLEYLDEPFEIRKKQIKLFNKLINLQIFDTSEEFYKYSNLMSDVYYESVSAFFIFIEFTNHNVKNYLDFIFEKINKYINNRTIVIFEVNTLFEKNCTIDGENIHDYLNEKEIIFIPININNFDMKNQVIKNLLNFLLIKRIDNKKNITSNRKGSKDGKLGTIKNKLKDKINNDSNNKKNIYDLTKINVPSSLGYNKKYRIKHINAFDIEDENDKIKKRKLSVDI